MPRLMLQLLINRKCCGLLHRSTLRRPASRNVLCWSRSRVRLWVASHSAVARCHDLEFCRLRFFSCRYYIFICFYQRKSTIHPLSHRNSRFGEGFRQRPLDGNRRDGALPAFTVHAFSPHAMQVIIVTINTWGALYEWCGARPIYLSAFFLCGAATALYPATSSLLALTAARCIFSVGAAGLATMISTVLAAYVSSQRKGMGASYTSLASGVGALVAALFFFEHTQATCFRQLLRTRRSAAHVWRSWLLRAGRGSCRVLRHDCPRSPSQRYQSRLCR